MVEGKLRRISLVVRRKLPAFRKKPTDCRAGEIGPCSAMKRIFFAVGTAALLVGTPWWLSAQSSREVNAEANAIDTKEDKKLNAAYETLIKDIRAHHDKDQAEFIISSLRESQRAWLKYREAQIAFVGTYNEIGSPSARNAGLALYSRELTEARIKDFQGVPDPF